MVRKIISFAAILFLGIISLSIAQERKKEPKIHKPTATTYLHGGQIGDNDSVSVSRFTSLLSHKLIVKDSIGRTFPVQSFRFIYINRGVYADKEGKPIVLSDYLYSNSANGLLPDFWKDGLIPQIKSGDTAIFTDIRYYPIIPDTNAITQTDSGVVSIINADSQTLEMQSADSLKSVTDTIAAPLLYGKTIRVSIY